jgi:hypothetical protein
MCCYVGNDVYHLRIFPIWRTYNSILCNKIYKRYFRHAFYVAERVFNKQVSREVYKRVEYYTFSTTKLTNETHKRNKQLFY